MPEMLARRGKKTSGEGQVPLGSYHPPRPRLARALRRFIFQYFNVADAPAEALIEATASVIAADAIKFELLGTRSDHFQFGAAAEVFAKALATMAVSDEEAVQCAMRPTGEAHYYT